MELALNSEPVRGLVPEPAAAFRAGVVDAEVLVGTVLRTDGMPVAPQAPQMKMSGKEPLAAPECDAPSGTVLADAATEIGVRSRSDDSAGIDKSKANGGLGILLEAKAWSWLTSPANTPLEPTSPMADSASTAPAATVERLEQLVSREVTVLRKLRAESLTVVLKPDQHTEMVLQLHRHPDGPIEATLRCDPDVSRRFQGHWTQLQDSLAQMNVRLQPLQENLPLPPVPVDSAASTSSFGHDAATGREDRARHGDHHSPAEEPDRPAPRPAANPPTGGDRRTRRMPAQGWESWA